MKKTVFYLFAAALFVFGAEAAQAQNAQTLKSADGVDINGVTWATRNVNAKGKFAKNPSDAGRYYNFDEARAVCPEGWRTPTASEFESLIAAGSEWTTVDGVAGRVFGCDAGSIFLPAAGGRYTYQKELADVGSSGYYWSSIAYSGADLDYKPNLDHNGYLAYDLRFSAGEAHMIYHNNRAFGFSVRCVAE